MIFKDIVSYKKAKLSAEFDRLIEYAWKNQSHVGNLLLLYVNGFYRDKNPEISKLNNEKYTPYTIGRGFEKESEYVHYNFIHKYRTTNVHPQNHSEYIQQFDQKLGDRRFIDRNRALIEIEGTSIQIEMLIYLKFWEADMIIKKLYQFVRILQGQDYDWHFKLSPSNRSEKVTGARHKIVRLKIRDPLKEISPILYELISESYITQIRNSIAHSNYSFSNRGIFLNNYIDKDPKAQLIGISFDEWVNIFHNTLVLHNEYNRMNNYIHKLYSRFAIENQMEVPILITEKDGTQIEKILQYRKKQDDWSPKKK